MRYLLPVLLLAGCLPCKETRIETGVVRMEHRRYAIPATCPAGAEPRPYMIEERVAETRGPSVVNPPSGYDLKKATMPSAKLTDDGMKATGNGMRMSGDDLAEVASRGPVALYVLGGLCVVAGVALAIVAKQLPLGAGIAGAGIVLIGCAAVAAKYAWVYAVALLVAAVLGVVLVLGARGMSRLRVTLAAIVGGVEAAGPHAAPVKACIKAAAGTDLPTVKAVVGAEKARASPVTT